MLKKSWLFLLPLVAGLLWVGTAPSQAAGPLFAVSSVNSVGCASVDITLGIAKTGFDGGSYTIRTTAIVAGKTYMDQDFTSTFSDGSTTWGIGDIKNYGPVSDPGTWPMPAANQVTILLSVERPKGTVLSVTKLVLRSCDSSTILYNGLASADTDNDLVATPTDVCPSLQGFTANGCPVRARTLSLKAKYGPKRVVGRLYAAGYPALYAGRTVTIWKVRPGPDLRVRTRITNSLGKFKAKLPKGRYYAMSGGVIVPTAGEATANTSGRARLR